MEWIKRWAIEAKGRAICFLLEDSFIGVRRGSDGVWVWGSCCSSGGPGWAGTVTWVNWGGLLHSVDGPALEKPSGRLEWYIDGKLHRDGGPAVFSGLVEWHGEETSYEGWYRDGVLHRLDGAAVEWACGFRSWWIGGVEYSFKDWLGRAWDGMSADKKKEYIFGGFNAEL